MASISRSSPPVVLVVEDEPLSRMYAVSVAEDAGFAVVSAGNADEAIALLEARPDIRIVFTDVDMPGSMDGLRLSRLIRDRWPPIELIVTSGHSNVRSEDLPARGRYFPKPFDAERLTATLKEFGAGM